MSDDRRPHRVLYLIPSDTIGGVEMAAHSLPAGLHGDIAFQKYFMAPDPTHDRHDPAANFGPPVPLNSLSVYLATIRFVLHAKPDLLIASLWRSVLVMLVCKVLRPSLKTVVFLHSSGTAHAMDRMANAVAMRIATEIWTDSSATLRARLSPTAQRKGKVVSFLLQRRTSPKPKPRNVRPAFIFWGRLRKQKNICRAVAIFDNVLARYPEATFRIIGPDGDERNKIEADIRARGLESAISLLGPKDLDQIAEAAQSAHFYLQTSHEEGMAISVVEAMQFGLIPVVTPVGEIATYCTDGTNAVFIKDDAEVLVVIDAILADPQKARAISEAAVGRWVEAPLYRDDVLRLARSLLTCPDPAGRPNPL